MRLPLSVVSNDPSCAGELRDDRLLTTREVADYLGLSTESVLRRWRAGELPGFRLAPNLLRFRAAEIEDWLQARRDQDAERAVA